MTPLQRRAFYRLILVYLIPTCVLALLFLTLSSERHSARGAGPTYIPGGSITGTVTWTLDGSPYIVHGSVAIESNSALTIEPGVEVRFEANTDLSVSGRLVAIGTVTQPITFTSALTSPQPGDWAGLLFMDGSHVQLTWCDVGYAGFLQTGGLSIYSSDVQVSDCRIHHNNTNGVYLAGSGLKPSLMNLQIEDNAQAAVWQASVDAAPIYRNLTATNNLTDAVVIEGGTIAAGIYWDFAEAGVPILINGSIGVDYGRFLALGPGTTLRFITGTLGVMGSLYAAGEPDAPITFTGFLTTPGAWGGIHVANTGGAFFNHCDLAYGGGLYKTLLAIDSNNTVLQNCRIHHSAGDGIAIWEAQPTIVANQIYSNAQVYTNAFGLRSTNHYTPVDARYNWWGHASGPYHPTLNPGGLGDPITGNVLFDPWLTSADEAGPGLPAARLVVELGGPDQASPGQTVDYALFYHNVTTQTITTPLVMQLPYNAGFLESTGDGIFWPTRRQVFWRQDLTPGCRGAVSARARFDWGLPAGTMDAAAAFLADPALSASYLAYTPTEVISSVTLSDAQFNALRQASPDFELLYTRTMTGGMRLGVVEQLTMNNGQVVTQAVLINPDSGAAVFLRHYGQQVSASQFERNTYTIMDVNGGATLDLNLGEWRPWGAWAPGGTTASATGERSVQSCNMNFGTCLANCIFENAPGQILSALFRAMRAVLASMDCVRCAGGNPAACASCAAALRRLPGVGEAIDTAQCIKDCKQNPSSHICTQPRAECSQGFQNWFGGQGEWVYKCDPSTCMYRPLPEFNACNRWQVCIDGQGCVDCYEYVGRGVHCRDLVIRTGHDPNAKYGLDGDLLPGQWVTYTIEYENEGAGAAYGVFIEDVLSEHLDDATLTYSGNGQYITSTRTLIWDIGQVAPKGQPGYTGTVIFTVQLKPNLPGGTVIANQAVVHFPSVPERTPTNMVVNVIQTVSAMPQMVHTGAQQPVAITLRGRDVGNAPLTYTLVSEPLYGELSGILPTLVYTPMENFVGVDYFSFQVSNGITESRPAEVTIFVDPSAADTTPPQVRWTEPLSGAVNVEVISSPVVTDSVGPAYGPFITIQFTEALSPTTVTTQTVRLLDSGGQPATVTVVYDGRVNQVQLIPRVPLRRGQIYTGWVAGDVRDASGNRMGADYTWHFWTEMYRLYLPVVLRNP